jgi:hypothetical protein
LNTLAELFTTLGRDPRLLLGLKESAWLDFKGEPHVSPTKTEDHHRLALARDVSALANAGGGVLVLGVATRRSEVGHEEIADALRPIHPAHFDPQQVRKVLNAWVFPTLPVSITQHPVPGDDGFLWTIHVERQSELSMPYMVARGW